VEGQIMSIFTGTFNNADWYQVFKDGKPFSHKRSYKYIKHSPYGFSWGYLGSGPSQLSFALLLEAMNNPDKCISLYHTFKEDVVSRWPQEGKWAITTEEILEWVKNHEQDQTNEA
jgi:hypothetical protein